MKKLLLLLFLILASFSTFANSNIDFTLSDFCYQQPNVQDRGGIYFFPNEEVGITAVSLCVYKDQYGQYESKGKLKNGSQDGEWTEWYENGQIAVVLYYKDGEAVGKGTRWYENGQKMHESYRGKDGELDGTWYFWRPNGQKLLKQNYKDGLLDGKFTSWDDAGLIMKEGIYKDGECISGDC